MSFGISTGDFITIGKIALDLYQQCHDAPDEFRALSSELANLRTVLELISLTMKERTLDTSQKAYLHRLQEGCQDVLEELETLLNKYKSLGTNRKWKWKWISWGREKVPDIRQRLISNIGMLTSFNTTLAA
jgi:hypothetical protein